MQKKVLLAKDLNKQTIGILSLECDESLRGTLKLFEEQEGTLVLKIGQNILAFENAKSNFNFKTVFHNLNLPTAMVLCSDKILAVAKTDNFNENINAVFEEFLQMKNKNLKKTLNLPYEKKPKDFEDDFENAKIEAKKIEKTLKNDANFEKNEKKISKNENSLAENVDKTQNFFEQIKDQFDELFKSGKVFEELEEKIENSKWVKIFAQQEFSNHYILGKIFDDENKLICICYGVPAKNEQNIFDDQMQKYCQWLPFEIEGESDSGYFLMYQDAQTGENILLD